MTPSLTIVILTFDEELHIARAIHSAQHVAERIVVVDSFSTDRTIEFARSLGAEVVQHRFETQARQLRWALENLAITTEWVMRMDADEVISWGLADAIRHELPAAPPSCNGFTVARSIAFNGTTITHGGFPHRLLKIWRHGTADVETRWMDEHMVLRNGDVQPLHGEYLDDNRRGLAWWIEKHRSYAAREAIDYLLQKYRPTSERHVVGTLPPEAKRRRWLKERIYNRFPTRHRAVLLFAYRMLVLQGWKDGVSGLPFHVLQGLWYRLLVDKRIRAVETRMTADSTTLESAIATELGIDITR